VDLPALLAELRSRGVTLVAEGDSLRVRPASRLTPGLRRLILRHKSALLAALRATPTPADLEVAARAIEQDLGMPPGSLILWSPR
jgi:hypothetical protein